MQPSNTKISIPTHENSRIVPPFGISVQALIDLVENRDTGQGLENLGGVEALASKLLVNVKGGISTTFFPSSNLKSNEPSYTLRKEVFGSNYIPPPKSTSFLTYVLNGLKDKLIILLMIASGLSIGLGIVQGQLTSSSESQHDYGWLDGLFIIIAIVIVVLLSAINDYKSEQKFKSLNATKNDRKIKVLRNNKETQVSIYDIVVGEVISLEPGDIIPADSVVFSSSNLHCDESGTTGESDPVKKSSTEDTFLLSGTKVIEGVAKALVISVGKHSLNGRLLSTLTVKRSATPLQSKLNDLAETIAKLGIGIALTMFIILLIKYLFSNHFLVDASKGPRPSTLGIFKDIIALITQAITILVVAVPEGLPMAVTIALSFATINMLKDNNLVRVFSACETMGTATTICSDKTGTLTTNVMTVLQARFCEVDFQSELELKALFSKLIPEISNVLLECICVNSTVFENTDIKTGKITVIGSKTEAALINMVKALGINYNSIKSNMNVVKMYPFSSEKKSMSTLVKFDPSFSNNSLGNINNVPTLSDNPNSLIPGSTGNYPGSSSNGPADPGSLFAFPGTSKHQYLFGREEYGYRFYVKGASEIILSYCESFLTSSGHKKAVSPAFLNETNVYINKLASSGLRTIGLAYKDVKESEIKHLNLEEPSLNKLTLLGIVGIEDPIRAGIPEAVLTCQQAGIFVRMVTGDNISTASSIARRCNILTTGGVVMEGPKFRALDNQALLDVIPKLQVLARSSPFDKQILVEKLKEMNEVVAVTGDGTNDGPALKTADVGFSMGITGTEVAKEASSIILMDDNFVSIVKAVSWGRCVNESVRKFLQFQLTVNITAVSISFISALIGRSTDAIFSVIQLLWINLIMDTMAALALATDKPHASLLERLPEPKKNSLITPEMWKMILGQALFQIVACVCLQVFGSSLFNLKADVAADDLVLKTFIFNCFVFFQIFNEFNCRSLHDSEFNIFNNLFNNMIFIYIVALTIAAQVCIIVFGGFIFGTVRLGLQMWIISLLISSLTIPLGIIIRCLPTWKASTEVSDRVIYTKERLHWQATIDNIKHGLSVFNALRHPVPTAV